jgi:aminoglycoside phosphotransferase (APT) family kinase protein
VSDSGHQTLGRAPNEQDAGRILTAVTGNNVASLCRFPTGLAHYVYDARMTNGDTYVVRLTRPEWRDAFAGALHWNRLLRPLGIPLPEIIDADPSGERYGFPMLIMERLPGTDLGEVYPILSIGQKRQIAREIIDVQRRVATLPNGSGFGYAYSHDGRTLKPSWRGVIDEHLEQSRGRMRSAGVIDEAVVDRVWDAVDARSGYIARVEPRCFLDDTTTKNVIIANGRLSGIVDVDFVCFGDPLRTLALTQMALLNLDYDLIYTDAWMGQLALSKEQHDALTLYTAIYCVAFMSEIGQRFNKEAAPLADPIQIRHLSTILDTLLQTLGS